MPISGRNRPPRSKMRRTLPGWLISKRGSGSRYGTTPFFVDLLTRSAAARSAAAAARRSCCSSRRSGPACSGTDAVVVEGRAPQHAAVGHHALAVLQHLLRVAAGRAAADVGDAQVAGVDEADELGRLVVEQRVRADRVGRRRPGVGEPRRRRGPRPCRWPSASPPWQSVQPSRTVSLSCGSRAFWWQWTQPDALGGRVLGGLARAGSIGGAARSCRPRPRAMKPAAAISRQDDHGRSHVVAARTHSASAAGAVRRPRPCTHDRGHVAPQLVPRAGTRCRGNRGHAVAYGSRRLNVRYVKITSTNAATSGSTRSREVVVQVAEAARRGSASRRRR